MTCVPRDESPTYGAQNFTQRRAGLIKNRGAHWIVKYGAVLLQNWLALLSVKDCAHLCVHQATFIITFWLIKAPYMKEE